MDLIFTITVVLAFLFAFVNGFHDGCNVIATVVSSRSLSPEKSLFIACIAEFVGAIFLGTAVAVTIGKGIISSEILFKNGKYISYLFLFSALIGAIIWNIITWIIGLPSSSSHALIGGIVGAGCMAFGYKTIGWHALLWKVGIPLFITPIIGLVIGHIFMEININIFKNAHPRVNNFFKKFQVFSMTFLAASHGMNDSQKTMGVITMLLLISGKISEFKVPLWVILTSAACISLGLSTGGWKIVKTVGTRIYRVKPIHSFTSQTAAGFVIYVAGLLGGPVSTTQIVSSSIMGVGSAHRLNAVRWTVSGDILLAWLLTIPASSIISSLVFLVTKYLLR